MCLLTQQVKFIKVFTMLMQGMRHSSTRSLLKNNTKGSTAKVFEGGVQALQGIKALQLELPFFWVYGKGLRIGDILASLYSSGFKLHYAYSELYDEKHWSSVADEWEFCSVRVNSDK